MTLSRRVRRLENQVNGFATSFTTENLNVNGSSVVTGTSNVTGNLNVTDNIDTDSRTATSVNSSITNQTFTLNYNGSNASAISSGIIVAGTGNSNYANIIVGGSGNWQLKSTDGSINNFDSLVIDGTTTLSGATSLGSSLGVSGATSLSTLSTSGAATLNSATVSGTLTVNGATTLNSTLDVNGAMTTQSITQDANNNLNQSGAGIINQSGSGTNALKSSSVTGTLGVSGATTLSSTLGVSGATTLSSSLGVTGATTLSSTLNVSGSSSLSTLSTSGAATLNSLTVTNNASVGGTLTVSGGATLSSTLNVSGTSTLGTATITNLTATNSTLTNVVTLGVPNSGSIPSTDRLINWNANLLTVGTGTGYKTMVDTDSIQTLTNKTLSSPTMSGTVTFSSTVNMTSGNLILPNAASPSLSADGQIAWDNDNDLLQVYTGATTKTMVDTNSTQTLSGKTVQNLVLAGSAPGSSGATGTAGQIIYDSNYVYICTATNTWKRAALSTW